MKTPYRKVNSKAFEKRIEKLEKALGIYQGAPTKADIIKFLQSGHNVGVTLETCLELAARIERYGIQEAE